MPFRRLVRPVLALSLSAAALAVALTVPANDVVQHAVSVVDEPRALLSLGTLWDAAAVHAVLTAVRGC